MSYIDEELLEVHVKGLALVVLAENGDIESMSLFEGYAHNEHEFLRTVAEWCIKEVNKAKETK